MHGLTVLSRDEGRQSEDEKEDEEEEGREGEREKPASVLWFIWSFIRDRQTARERQKDRQNEWERREEQKQSRDFQEGGGAPEINTYSFLFLGHSSILSTPSPFCLCLTASVSSSFAQHTTNAWTQHINGAVAVLCLVIITIEIGVLMCTILKGWGGLEEALCILEHDEKNSLQPQSLGRGREREHTHKRHSKTHKERERERTRDIAR